MNISFSSLTPEQLVPPCDRGMKLKVRVSSYTNTLVFLTRLIVHRTGSS